MASILSETFTTGIPGGFATWIGQNQSTAVATYDGTNLAVDLSQNAFNASWRIDAVAPSLDMRVVVDLEVVTLDRGFGSASGFGISFGGASHAEYVQLQGFTGTGGTVTGLIGASNDVIGAVTATAGGSTAWSFPSTGRYTYEYRCIRLGNRRQYQFLEGGVLVHLVETNWIPTTDTITPALLFRDSKYKLHQIDIYDDATALSVALAGVEGGIVGPSVPFTWPAVSKWLEAG